MAALTTGRNTPEVAAGYTLLLPLAAGAKVFDGALVALDEDGNAAPASKAENLTAAGRAEEFLDNSTGTDGDLTIEVSRGVFVWDNDPTPASAVKATDILKDCYILDDHTVTMTADGSSVAGKVIAVSDEGVTVETL